MADRGYERSRRRSDEIRAGLEPLGPDERPLGIKLAAALAAAIAVANVVGVIAGAGNASPAVGLAFAVMMGGAAVGLWQRRYLVVLGFEALLAVAILYAALSLLLASSLLGLLLGIGVIVICSPIFWLLVRVMARLQVPPR